MFHRHKWWELDHHDLYLAIPKSGLLVKGQVFVRHQFCLECGRLRARYSPGILAPTAVPLTE